MREQEIGRRFEEDLAAEFGISRVPGSGNQFHSKLDVKGRGARWSLKATKFASFQLGRTEIDEMVDATLGPGGTGEIPLMAVRLGASMALFPTREAEDLIIMRKDDFKMLATGEYQLVQEDKSSARMRVASIPELLREAEEDENDG